MGIGSQIPKEIIDQIKASEEIRNGENIDLNKYSTLMQYFEKGTIYDNEGNICYRKPEEKNIAGDISNQIDEFHNGGSNEEDREI